ncbi:hypothetical protein CFIO01_00608 [Colletotrichum fioriniae PJ7]|uniref:Uncharacterized protein n=1 Tax=Colletotrichum fioriniae PJ7 TaxID=1445577 RepID=A0A010RVD6_9PEZI|nr:hypothetical protein CFIO01_00608 [Colletotrichum fioriniae PJ7]
MEFSPPTYQTPLQTTTVVHRAFDEYDSLVQASRSLRGRKASKLWLIDSRLRRKQTIMQIHTMLVLGDWLYSGHGQQAFEENGCKFYAMPDYASQDFCGDVKDDSVIAAQVSGFVVALVIVARHQDAQALNCVKGCLAWEAQSRL